jgi:hypothetical protein
MKLHDYFSLLLRLPIVDDALDTAGTRKHHESTSESAGYRNDAVVGTCFCDISLLTVWVGHSSQFSSLIIETT